MKIKYNMSYISLLLLLYTGRILSQVSQICPFYIMDDDENEIMFGCLKKVSKIVS